MEEGYTLADQTPKPISENSVPRQLRTDLASSRALLGFVNKLNGWGLPPKLPDGLTDKLDDLDQQLAELSGMPDRFNALFVDHGWIAHESMNADLMRRAVEIHATEGPASAEQVLVDGMDADTIRFGINRVKWLPSGSLRWPLLNLLRDDYAEGRYHAVVPNLLAQIDGLVNDVEPTGFFAATTDLVVDDSIAGHASALQAMRKVLSRCTNKTRDDSLKLPFRNGILHGRELGFGNKLVAAKCWALLFAVSDMLSARRSPPPTPRMTVTWGDTIRQLRDNAKNKAALQRWRPRRQTVGVDLAPATHSVDVAPDSPEHAVLALLEALRGKNYGQAAKLTHAFSKEPDTKRAGDIRRDMDGVEIITFTLTEVDHSAAALARVHVKVERRVHDRTITGPVEFLLNHNDASGQPVIPGEDDGTWSVVQWSLIGLLQTPDAP